MQCDISHYGPCTSPTLLRGSGPRRRIAHVTLAHTPYDVRIFEKECQSLADAGYEVLLLVPNTTSHTAKGVHLRPIEVASKRGTLRRYLQRLATTYRIARSTEASVYHLHDPELVPVGLLLKRHGAKIVYDAHEDAPVEALSLNKGRPIKGRMLSWTWRFFMEIAARSFDGFVAATPAIAAKLPDERTILARNFPRLEQFRSLPVRDHQAGPARLIYVGGISEIRGIREMLDAVRIVTANQPVRLRLAGPFASDQLLAELKTHPAWHLVDYLGVLSWERTLVEISQSDIGFVVLYPTPEYQESLPVKMFEYMTCGIPVVASDFPLWREIIGSAQCGLLVNPRDPEGIARATVELLRNPERARQMGESGRQAAAKHYTWGPEAERLIAFYARLT